MPNTHGSRHMGMPADIAGYQVLAVLGHGAQSTIYAVRDPKTGDKFAMKHIVRKKGHDNRFFEQAITEHEICSTVNHPAIRKTHQLIKHRKLLRTTEVLLLMDLVHGKSLEQRRPEKIGELNRIFVQIAEALHAMHQAGYVHCDMKPNNVLVDDHQKVCLIDFGQACKIGTVKKRIQGTPDFIAPEQVNREAITPQTDIYNFGATMYWCLCGEYIPTVFQQAQNNLAGDKPAEAKSICELNPKVPKQLDGLIHQCIQLNPAERPASMQHIAATIKIVFGQNNRTQHPGAMAPPQAKTRKPWMDYID